jgi:hypothetical protein
MQQVAMSDVFLLPPTKITTSLNPSYMKKVNLTILCAFIFCIAHAQFTVTPGEWKLITINSKTYKIFVPADYNTGSDYYLHVAFYGDGQKSGSALDDEEPGTFLNDNGTNWNGEVHMNDNSVAKFIIFGIPNYDYNVDIYAKAIDSVIKVLVEADKIDTSVHDRFSCSGFSGGPGRMWGYLTNDNNNAPGPNRLLFQNTISISCTWIGVDVTGRSAQGRHWVWYATNDPNTGTPPAASLGLYSNITGTKRITAYSASCHCGWNECMNIDGTGVSNGGSASSSRWRWLVNPNDTTATSQPEGAYAVGALRQKKFGNRDFLYYIPDTAQRATLKYYFMYNILDSSGKDSAYAVQRGLAKKYKNGWNGKVPLCTGDTAVFTMVTQLNAPDKKDTLELGIQWALDSLPNHIFDTAYATNRMKNIFTGIGHGPNSQVTYLMNKFSVLGQGTAKFRRNFGVLVSLDQKDNGFISSDGWGNIDVPFKSWWWTSNTSGYPYMPSTSRICKDSADNRNPGSLTRITELALSYSQVTWDSAYSTASTSAANNVFRWIVDTSDCTAPPSAPPPYYVGQLRKKTMSNRDYLYYIPDTAQRATLKYYFMYNILDSSGKDSAYAVQRGLAKKYKNGWNGKLPLCNGDTAVFTMVTQLNAPDKKDTLELGIQWALDSLPNHVFDTAYATNRMKNIFTGIGYGPNSQVTYLMNKFSVLGQGTAKFRRNFGVLVSLDQKDNGFISSDGWGNIDVPFKSWWWTSNTSGYPYMPSTSRICKDSADNRNPGDLTKITELALSYSSVTWDSAYSTLGATAANNVFRWIVDTAECEEMPRGIGHPVTEITPDAGANFIGVSPNPANQVLNIAWQADKTGMTELRIIDMQGRMVYRKRVSFQKGYNKDQLSIQSLAPGQYMVQLAMDKNISTMKFLKQ